MPKKQIQVDVSENTYAVVQALVAFAAKVKQQLDDGFQIVGDVSALIPEVLSLAAEVTRLSQVDDELKEDATAWAMALVAGASPMASLFKKKEENAPTA